MAALDRGNCVHGEGQGGQVGGQVGGQGRRREGCFPTSVLVVFVWESLRAHVSRQFGVLRAVGYGG